MLDPEDKATMPLQNICYYLSFNTMLISQTRIFLVTAMRMLGLTIYEVCNSPSAHVLLDHTVCFFKHSIVLRFTKHNIWLQQVLIEGVKTCTKTTKPPYPASWLHINHITFMTETDDAIRTHKILKLSFPTARSQRQRTATQKHSLKTEWENIQYITASSRKSNEQQLPAITKTCLPKFFLK